MTISELEKALILKTVEKFHAFLREEAGKPSLELTILGRYFSGGGFISDFQKNPKSRLFRDDFSLTGGDFLGRLNSDIEVVFVLYIENGYLVAMEGATYGEELWPEKVRNFQIYSR